jgi:hypothetical protein
LSRCADVAQTASQPESSKARLENQNTALSPQPPVSKSDIDLQKITSSTAPTEVKEVSSIITNPGETCEHEVAQSKTIRDDPGDAPTKNVSPKVEAPDTVKAGQEGASSSKTSEWPSVPADLQKALEDFNKAMKRLTDLTRELGLADVLDTKTILGSDVDPERYLESSIYSMEEVIKDVKAPTLDEDKENGLCERLKAKSVVVWFAVAPWIKKAVELTMDASDSVSSEFSDLMIVGSYRWISQIDFPPCRQVN